jgi:hypothetical protein
MRLGRCTELLTFYLKQFPTIKKLDTGLFYTLELVSSIGEIPSAATSATCKNP